MDFYYKLSSYENPEFLFLYKYYNKTPERNLVMLNGKIEIPNSYKLMYQKYLNELEDTYIEKYNNVQ